MALEIVADGKNDKSEKNYSRENRAGHLSCFVSHLLLIL